MFITKAQPQNSLTNLDIKNVFLRKRREGEKKVSVCVGEKDRETEKGREKETEKWEGKKGTITKNKRLIVINIFSSELELKNLILKIRLSLKLNL